jgi:hypothetical protein
MAIFESNVEHVWHNTHGKPHKFILLSDFVLSNHKKAGTGLTQSLSRVAFRWPAIAQALGRE